jgi:hypothetical protein
MRMKLQRLLLAAPLALMFASVASAQTTGNIIGVVTDAQSGKPVVGALVVATSPASQGEQTAVTDKSGGFRFQLLPPGEYKLAASFDGFKPAERADLTVRVDKTIRANLSMVPDAVQMEEQVVKTSLAPVVNVGSAEAGSVVSREFMSNVPTSRGFEGVAITAPTAQVDRYGISFAGSSSPENGYLIDGMNVGDTAYGTLGTSILTNFVQELDIKTGAFMPEYGFSSGGIVSVVTKSGSNEFHGSVFANLTPGALTADGKTIGRNAEALASRPLPKDGTYRADFGFEVGGPIMKDRLWFYAGFAPQLARNSYEKFQQATNFVDGTTATIQKDANGFATATMLPGSETKFTNKTDTYQMVGKLTYLINENNSVSLSVTNVPSTSTGFSWDTTPNQSASSAAYDLENSATDVVARYTSKLLSKKMQLEVTGGYHHQTVNNNAVVTGATDGGTVAQMQWQRTHTLSDFEVVNNSSGLCTPGALSGYNPCRTVNYLTGGSGFVGASAIARLAGKLGVTYFAEGAGNHVLKAGLDLQMSTYDNTKGYTGPNKFDTGGDFVGGVFMRERTNGRFQDFRRYASVDALNLVATDAPGGKVNVKSQTSNNAFYLQDSYSPSFAEGLTLNAGVRWEMQGMSVPDLPGSQSLSINNSIGPRIQGIYDWTKQGRSKVSANWGRFFSSFPLDMADRAFGDERQVRAYRTSCVTPATVTDKESLAGKPEMCPVRTDIYTDAYGNPQKYQNTGAGSTPVDPNIKSPYVDQFGAAVEYEVFADVAIGFEYQGRRQNRVIEDMSTDDGSTYFISNPGENKPFTVNGTTYDPKNAVSTDPVTGRGFTTPFPRPQRDYDGFTVLARKNFSSNWLGQVSYTYSSLRGNYPGYFRPETGQLDPGITSMFDLASLLANQSGPLPGDAPHSFKLYGSYTFDFGPKLNAGVGTGLRVTSGTPVNYLIAHPDYGSGEGYGLPRGSAGRLDTVTNLDLQGRITYIFTPPYQVKFSVDVFNILNSQTATSVDQNWTFDATQPIINGQCSGRNAVGKANVVSAALADCPSLQYLRTTDGNLATINTNFGKPTAFQTPLTVRFGLELAF